MLRADELLTVIIEAGNTGVSLSGGWKLYSSRLTPARDIHSVGRKLPVISSVFGALDARRRRRWRRLAMPAFIGSMPQLLHSGGCELAGWLYA